MENKPFTFEHLANIHFIYGLADGNALEARRMYSLRFPLRRLPNCRTFTNSHQHLREFGRFQTTRRDAGRPREVRNVMIEEEILHVIEENPSLSTRQIARDLNLCQAT